MRIGPYELPAPLALAPMAGITDKPFRQLCRRFGAAWAASEMLTSDPSLQHTRKTRQRADHDGEQGIRVVQIAGSHPQQLAEAARFNVAQGADVIDINMGCPAKKVCNVAAGSALLQNEALVADILQAVVQAVPVPVTLKTRLGWDDEHENIATIAHLAEKAGISALAIHGRTRTQMYRGEARYDKITQLKQEIHLPIWVNGDIISPQKAWQVWQQTGADGVMIGRGAQGQPWIFRDVLHYFQTGRLPAPLSMAEHAAVVAEHIAAMHAFYGAVAGVRIARKHITWYVSALPGGDAFRRQVNQEADGLVQQRQLDLFLNQQVAHLSAWPCAYRPQSQQAA
ncbi:tRNA dihydrouridine synthase DusB [Snodgrassella sp. CFCC 13594]|uniref:tRNA dihydrouridine synthase DusB n=1 Tax=Snodgrassella sp. CFCC 13594 TaxID=1775559 RepID=UPI00082D8142|nr:tRNA dihydrouridine synthase DusB [Snodgrassella sp. CFCC 13594]